ncbi:unnamed protein product [Rotaria sp. Silwood1]|nr:unnamed protein product [Rotaria sp. Silwood1]
MSTFYFGKAEYSINFFLASILIFISTCCCISAFASPYCPKPKTTCDANADIQQHVLINIKIDARKKFIEYSAFPK